MNRFLNHKTQASISFILYRYRLLISYIIIGVISLCIESLIYRALTHFLYPPILAQYVGFFSGIAAAFWLNVRFNFKIPKAKRNKALSYFITISLMSGLINALFRDKLISSEWSYEQARFSVSAIVFSFAYILHRKFSFTDLKQVGVAVYANGVEDIAKIRSSILDFPDFIHVDLIDSTFGNTCNDVKSYRMETIKAYWPDKTIHVHIMSKNPLKWIKNIAPHSDIIFFHFESDDSIEDCLHLIKSLEKTPGLTIMHSTPIKSIQHLLPHFKYLTILSINEPGKSGQSFNIRTLDLINEINNLPERKNINLCIDGGVNEKNIHLLNVELVVSGSSVLNAPSPKKQIMRLQTSSNYESI